MGNNIVIDKTTFSASVKNDLLNSEIKSLLAENHWSLTSGKYKKLRMKEVFAFMRVSQVESIHLWERNHKQILSDFCHVKFTHLKILILENNQISSIQALGWAVFQNIQGISLNSNKIVSIKPLNKWNSKTLKSISFKQNKIHQLGISKMKVNKHSQSSEIILDDSNDLDPKPALTNDVSELFKTGFTNLVHLSIGNNKRIFQSKIQTVLGKKWDQIAIINSPFSLR